MKLGKLGKIIINAIIAIALFRLGGIDVVIIYQCLNLDSHFDDIVESLAHLKKTK